MSMENKSSREAKMKKKMFGLDEEVYRLETICLTALDVYVSIIYCHFDQRLGTFLLPLVAYTSS